MTGVVIERDVAIPMRDGVVLRAEIYRPATIRTTGLPAVMERTRYGKDRSRLSQVLDPVRAAEAGLVVVAQDTRGQGRSEGAAFSPFRDDFVDGYDTAEWIAWTVDHIFESQVRRFARPDTLRTGLEAAAGLIDDFESLARTVPLTAVGDRLRELVVELAGGEGQAGAGDALQYFDDVVRRRPLPLANGSPLRGRTHAAVKVPVRLTAGWYDVILGHDLEHFRRMREHSPPDDTPPVRAFMQGIDRWRFEDDWPPPGMVPEAWHLHGGGRLAREGPAWEPASDTFVDDPADPCPTLGGDLVKPPSYVPGPVDQRQNLGRRDVLCYRSGPLERDLWLLGPVRAEWSRQRPAAGPTGSSSCATCTPTGGS